MPRTRNPYPAEFRDHLIALARSGRSVENLAREFEPCVATIHGWIKQVTGKRPLVAVGNSNGDQHMLQFAANGGGLALLLHHTDGDREDNYNSHTDKVMPLAEKGDWTIIDMKQDWKKVFPE